MQKIRNGLMALLTFLMLFAAVAYFYSTVIEEPYLYYKKMPFEVSGPVYPGGAAIASVIRCNDSGHTKSYTTTRGFQKMGANALPILLPSIDLTVEPGCEEAISRINVVPDNTLPGFYRFAGVASVRGLLTWHEVPWGTVFFEVIAKPAKEPEIVLLPSNRKIEFEVKP